MSPSLLLGYKIQLVEVILTFNVWFSLPLLDICCFAALWWVRQVGSYLLWRRTSGCPCVVQYLSCAALGPLLVKVVVGKLATDELLYKESNALERTNAWIHSCRSVPNKFHATQTNWEGWSYIAFILAFLRKTRKRERPRLLQSYSHRDGWMHLNQFLPTGVLFQFMEQPHQLFPYNRVLSCILIRYNNIVDAHA